MKSKIAASLSQPSRILSVASLLLLVALLVQSAGAQVGSAAISGTVQDSTGAIIPGATVTLQGKTTGAQRSLARQFCRIIYLCGGPQR